MEPTYSWHNTQGLQVSKDMKIAVLKKWLYLPKENASCMTHKYLDLLGLQNSNIYRLEWDRYNQKLIENASLSQKKKCSLNVETIIGKLQGYFMTKGIHCFHFPGDTKADKRNIFFY